MHITIGTPVLGMVDPRFVASLVKATAEATRLDHRLTWTVVMQDAMLARARNTIVQQFLASDSSRLVFIDADTVFTYEDIRTLVETDRDITAAEVSRKSGSGATNVIALPGGIVDGAWSEVAFVGTGFMSISRKCLESMAKQYSEYNYRNSADGPECCALFNTGVASGQFVGEDVAFCLNWRKMGGRVWVHSGLDIGHIGTFDYRVQR